MHRSSAGHEHGGAGCVYCHAWTQNVVFDQGATSCVNTPWWHNSDIRCNDRHGTLDAQRKAPCHMQAIPA
eukprot:3194062-Alexandrium_andersonii.AAC.1